MMLVPASMLAAAAFASLQSTPAESGQAERALRAALDAVAANTTTVTCFPSSHYSDAEPCDVMKASIPALDLKRLADYRIAPCILNARRTRCATLTFDRGRADQSQTYLIIEADGNEVRTRADVISIVVYQGLQTSD